MRKKNNLYLLLSSCLFVASTAVRLQGIVSFPIEIIIIVGFFIFHLIQKKYRSNHHTQNIKFLHSTNANTFNYTYVINERVVIFYYYYSISILLLLILGVFFIDDLLLLISWFFN